MRPPFDAQQFFAVFARYNLAVWPASAAVQLGVWEDLGLVAAGGLTLAMVVMARPRGGRDAGVSTAAARGATC
jgi:hypothetical protein